MSVSAKKGKRPTDINDLNLMWAIRDISSTKISFIERGILFFLLSVIGNNNSCYYFLNDLSKKTGISRTQLKIHLASLQEKNFISSEQNKGRSKRNEYFLNYYEIIKQSESDPFTKENSRNPTLLSAKTVGIRQENSRNPTPLYKEKIYNKDIHKKQERARAEKLRAEEPHTDYFLPNEENKILCDNLGLDLADEVQKFLSRHKYQKTQTEFAIWLKGSSSYKKSNYQNSQKQSDEIKSTVQFWGRGHPGWEALHGKRRREA